MLPPQDKFAFLVWSIITFIQKQKASNACTIVDFMGELADRRLPDLAKNLASSPTDMRSDFTLGHSALAMPDIPYSHVVALEQNGVVSASTLNHDMLNSTGFCNMAFKGKFICFKYKYLGVAPSPNNSTHDDAKVFALKITDALHDTLGDMLLFCANVINVIGIEPAVFKTVASTHWATLTSQDKHAGKHHVSLVC